jgi:hypothetical protein
MSSEAFGNSFFPKTIRDWNQLSHWNLTSGEIFTFFLFFFFFQVINRIHTWMYKVLRKLCPVSGNTAAFNFSWSQISMRLMWAC